MATPTAAPRRLPVTAIVIGAITVIVLIAGLFYLSRPASKVNDAVPSAEAKAYLSHLQLSDVSMKATENFMKQQVLEIEGKITNNGPRPIKRIEVECIFPGLSDPVVYRERVPIVTTELAPNQTRQFRLPFDRLPDSWNQAMPRLVIAQIVFGG
jgi:hypothetical protein